MSYDPNRPHDSRSPYAYPQGGHMYPGPQAQKPSSAKKWILILLGLGFGGFILCCGGCLLLVNYGTGIIESEVAEQLVNTPEFQENFGDVQSFKTNWSRSTGEEDFDTFVYDVRGSKGNGFVTVNHFTDDNDYEEIREATITMSDGREIPVSIQ